MTLQDDARVERVTRLMAQYPDYLDDPDGLERFRRQVQQGRGHDMASANIHSLGRLIDTIERLRFERDEARHRANAERGWEPIESAPRDGSIMLLHTARLEPPVGLGWFEDEITSSGKPGWLQFEADGMGSYADPTHWRPLPAPPGADDTAPPAAASDDETYEIGKRDGYEAAVQEIDLLTGGDGEYRYCMGGDPERHCPDAPTMIARIVERFTTPPAAAAHPGVGELVEALEWFLTGDIDVSGMALIYDDMDDLERRLRETRALLARMEALDQAVKQFAEPMSPFNSHELGERLAGDVAEIVRHARCRASLRQHLLEQAKEPGA